MTAPRRFLFLLASGRAQGNTEALARRAAEHLPEGAEARWIRLSEHPLPPFEDTRHSSGYGEPEDHARLLADATLWCTDLVFVAPVYWYSIPAPLKLYLDHWSGWMRVPSIKLREAMAGRRLWAVVVDSDQGNEGSAAPALETMRLTADFMEMQWMGALQGHGSKPGDALKPETLAAADTHLAAPVVQ